MKKVAYGISLLLLAYLAYTFYQFGKAAPKLIEVTGKAGLISSRISMDRLDSESGELLYTLNAQQAIHNPSAIEFREVTIDFHRSQLQQVTTPASTYLPRQEVLELPVYFTVTSVDGFVLQGKDAIYDVRTQHLVSERPFTLSGAEGQQLSGDRFEIWNEEGRLRADGNIRGVWGVEP